MPVVKRGPDNRRRVDCDLRCSSGYIRVRVMPVCRRFDYYFREKEREISLGVLRALKHEYRYAEGGSPMEKCERFISVL